jgi:hypothetical protein
MPGIPLVDPEQAETLGRSLFYRYETRSKILYFVFSALLILAIITGVVPVYFMVFAMVFTAIISLQEMDIAFAAQAFALYLFGGLMLPPPKAPIDGEVASHVEKLSGIRYEARDEQKIQIHGLPYRKKSQQVFAGVLATSFNDTPFLHHFGKGEWNRVTDRYLCAKKNFAHEHCVKLSQ